MILNDDQRAMVLGVIEYAGPVMDPDDQGFYLRWWHFYDDDPAAEEANVAASVAAGVVEIHPDTEGPVITVAAIEAALGGSEVSK